MKLSREEVLHIALLARVGITDEEVDKLSEQLSDILENFEALQQVNTDDIGFEAQQCEKRPDEERKLAYLADNTRKRSKPAAPRGFSTT